MALAIDVLTFGRASGTPETALAQSYLTRARDAGRVLALTGFTLIEIDERRPEKMLELSKGNLTVALDEQGKSIGSEAFARQLARWRDGGTQKVQFLIGAAAGLPAEAKAAASMTIAFGQQTWPHMLVRVMLAEQLYRAVTILTGHPYHRS
ncbi:MAG: 23S rRNA (pseudouridine(1915)-N(3))-methyltransferase RlmH [Alphaproteobacteria bacterium]|nr:23S rRNA (pseudouridine(1915)-N(3))-methyltransferase RlmH [Alphaproteobacteria bacterium]